ncbi:MAG: putative transposase [Devosia litorisediminis]
MPSEVRRLREVKDENRQLKQIVSDLTLYRAMHQDVIKRKL